jgi:hypothetical protein
VTAVEWRNGNQADGLPSVDMKTEAAR